ncbi:MAG: UvrD-helicase domain-containing protein [Verrucomicrobia bacterium]|nr:UvrD-helicase domain-containing protein [Verrucomicrobiota bacterium]
MAQLNPNQQKAVEHVEGPLLVLAGAGSGKTRVVTYRIAHLIDIGVLPSDILAVTFTNKAAEEMKSRIRSLKNSHVLACTFHSLGARILRESIHLLGYKNDFVIYDEEDSEKLLKTCMQQLQLGDEKGLLRTTRGQISSAKNSLTTPDKADRSFAPVYSMYQSKLKECNAVDFDDLLYLTVRLLKENEEARKEYQSRWSFVLIDEYQDTNAAQYTLARILVEVHGNLFAVGDPDQSIYSWRGAQYQNILNFERDFPGAKVIPLEENYRSTNTILQASNALIEHNPDRYEKKLWSNLGEGAKVGVFVAQSDRQEAEFVVNQLLNRITQNSLSLDDIAIFYRTNAQSRSFEDALLSKRLTYKIIGGLSFYQRREVKDLLSFLRMVVSNTDLMSFLRTINLPKRGLGMTTLEKLVEASANQPIFTFCEDVISRPDLLKLTPKQKEGLQSYVQLIRDLRNERPQLKIHELIERTIERSRYLQFLQEDPETFEDRKGNTDELINKAREWEEEQDQPSLTLFLEELSLKTTADDQGALPAIKLMTLHNSKGLEFPLVFLVGLEEQLLPHANSLDDPSKIEEERRLCYVGMTRAKRFLYLCAATYRYLWNTSRVMRPSRFLREIPTQYLQNLSPTTIRREVEEEHSEDPEGFAPGDKVIHKEFGEGIVQKSYHSSFGLTYDVHFPDAGTNRTLVAKFAKLQRSLEG